MKRIKLFLLLVIFPGMVLLAQQPTRYQYIEYKRALENQTRSLDGMPGPIYWQNSAAYAIEAELDPETNILSGQAVITYENNSPDTLKQLVFNLYQDIFRKGNSRDWDIGTDDLHDGTLIKSMVINGQRIDLNNRWQMRRQGTQLIVAANIAPASTSTIAVEWEVPVPSTRTIRMGRYSDSIFFVAYWYPQLAVYDDVDGWDMISYGGSVEFYNGFADYDVKIAMPEGWVLWATGLLQNAGELLHPIVVERYNKAWHSDEVVQIITQSDYASGKVTLPNKRALWHFKAEQVPDFSFGAGLGFNWDAVSLIVDAATMRRTLTDAVYPHGAIHYEKVAEFGRQSIQYMSETMPGIPFPYPQMTNFCNGRPGGGMETPMMANNSAPPDESNIFGLTFHEIAHTYFPFAMGTNEKKYAWMDEGFASLWPHMLVDRLYPGRRYIERTIATYQDYAGREMDIPPMVPNQLMGNDYPALRISSYVRPAVAFYFLEHAMGNELFTLALQTFMSEWEGKHPIPHDFFNTFERVAGEKLDWFFMPWFYEWKYPDLGIYKYTRDRQLIIGNEGGLPLPIQLLITYVDDSELHMELPITAWKSGDSYIAVNIPGELPVREISLGNDRIPDSNKRNNVLHIID